MKNLKNQITLVITVYMHLNVLKTYYNIIISYMNYH